MTLAKADVRRSMEVEAPVVVKSSCCGGSLEEHHHQHELHRSGSSLSVLSDTCDRAVVAIERLTMMVDQLYEQLAEHIRTKTSDASEE